MQFMKNVLVYVFGVFTFSFCYSVYEGFIHKIILVSLFLPFICISYPLKVFKFDSWTLRDSCAVPVLNTLSRLPQSIAFLRLILFPMFACNNYPIRAFATMIYWTSTEVLLNLFAPLNCISRTRFSCSFFWRWKNQYMVHGFDSISIA